jgi:DNA polymerase-3 subunit delta
MKFYKNQLNNLLGLIKANKVKALLLYGPDKGEISDIIEIIATQLKISINQIEYKEANSQSLYNIANSFNLFFSKELIKIQNVTSSITEDALSILSGTLTNFLVFVGDELPPSSSVRKAFESGEHLAALPCYVNDLRESMVIAKSMFDQYNKIIIAENLRIFCQIVGGMKSNIKNEVQKLLNYTDSKIITIEDILAISASEDEINPDLMSYSYIIQDKKTYFQEIDKLLNDKIEPVWIVRALGRYLLNVLKVKKSNLPIDIAIKTITPPIFFKQIPNLKYAVNNIDISHILLALEKLVSAEIDLKKGIESDYVLDELFYKFIKA